MLKIIRTVLNETVLYQKLHFNDRRMPTSFTNDLSHLQSNRWPRRLLLLYFHFNFSGGSDMAIDLTKSCPDDSTPIFSSTSTASKFHEGQREPHTSNGNGDKIEVGDSESKVTTR